MTLDAFRCLRAMGDREDLFDLASAEAEATKTAAALLGGAIAAADGEKLRSIGRVLGEEAFGELARKVKSQTVSDVVDRIDGRTSPKRTPALALKRLNEIARGDEPAPPPFPAIDKLELPALRHERRSRGPKLEASLVQQKTKVKKALKLLDPWFPGLGKATPEEAISRLMRLAEGADPVPEIRLAELDVQGLRRARIALGDVFELWLSSQKGPDLKAAVNRIDPQRAKGRKLATGEYPSILREIAGGGRLLQAEDEVEAIGEVRFSTRDG